MPDDRWWADWTAVSATWLYKEAVEFAGWDCIDEELAAEQIIDGRRRWRKMKGRATVRLSNGMIRESEMHWFESGGKGRVEYRIKRHLA